MKGGADWFVCEYAANVAVVSPGTLVPTGVVQFNKQPGNILLSAQDISDAGLAVYTTQIGDLFAGQASVTATCAAAARMLYSLVPAGHEIRTPLSIPHTVDC